MSHDQLYDWLCEPIFWRQKAWWWLCALPGRIKWFLLHRLHPSHRYHIVNTGFRPGFRDADSRMEACLVRLFLDYIENEKPFEWFETDGSEEWPKIKCLYDFFKGYNPHRPPYEIEWPSTDGKTPEEFWQACKECDLERRRLRDEFTEKLVELIRLREHYWT